MLELLGAHKDSPSLDTMAVPRLKLVNRLKSAAYNALQWQSDFLPSTMEGVVAWGRIENCKTANMHCHIIPPVN